MKQFYRPQTAIGGTGSNKNKTFGIKIVINKIMDYDEELVMDWPFQRQTFDSCSHAEKNQSGKLRGFEKLKIEKKNLFCKNLIF